MIVNNTPFILITVVYLILGAAGLLIFYLNRKFTKEYLEEQKKLQGVTN